MSGFWYMATALSGMALGAGIRDLWWKATTKPKTRDAVGPLEPVCRCDHEYTSHKNGGKCREDSIEWVNGEQEIWECACTAYLGPDPTLLGLWQHPDVINGVKAK